MLLLIFIIVSQIQASCISAIGNLLADTLIDPIQQLSKLIPYIQFSGKSINDFGLQEHCSKNYQYAILQFFVPQTPASINIGICFTKECSINDINHQIAQFKNWVIPIAQQISKVDLTDYQLILLDTSLHTQPTFITYLFLTVFFLFISLQIFITIKSIIKKPIIINIKYQLKQCNEEEEEEEQNFLNAETMDTQFKSLPNINVNNKNIDNNSNSIINVSSDNFINFNIIKNFELCCKVSKKNYESLNFLRILGFFMCVFGNTGISMLLQCDFIQVLHYSKHYILLIVFGCLYSVEIFLWLSGFFAVLSLNKINCFKHVLYRILKFWPLIIITILINNQIIPYLYEGPRWFYIERYTKCGKWWQNVLFINNFDEENYCTLWLWQISLDVQLTILCALLMFIYKKNKKLSIILTILLLILSQSYILYICFKKNYGIPYFSTFTTDIYKSFYYRPWYRAPPYFIGMLTAFFLLNYKKTINIKLQNVLLIIGIIIIIYLTIGWYDTMQYGQDYYPKMFSFIYEGTMRTIYSIGITLFCLPNLYGNKNFIYRLINYTPIKYLQQFTLSGYFIHMLVIEIIIASFYNRLDFNVLSITQIYTGCLIIIFLFAFIFRLFIELPMSIENKI